MFAHTSIPTVTASGRTRTRARLAATLLLSVSLWANVVAADKNGVVYGIGVTPPGLTRYTLATNTMPVNAQGRGPGSPGGPAAGSPAPTVPPPAGP